VSFKQFEKYQGGILMNDFVYKFKSPLLELIDRSIDVAVIRHPLSDGEIKIDCIEKDTIFSAIEEVFDEIAEKVNNLSEKDRLFYLWRNLYDLIVGKPDGDTKRYLSQFPAGAKVSNHSVWEHLKTASAFQGDSISLFLFTIGPVQSFIAQARKTQDLFSGSFLLSYLTLVGIEKVAERYGPANIIYPDLYKQPLIDLLLEQRGLRIENSQSAYSDQATIPNRFVAVLPECDAEKIKEVAHEVAKGVREEWNEIVVKILKNFGLDEYLKDSKLIEKQTKSFPEIYWVAVPLKKEGENVSASVFKDFVEEVKELKESDADIAYQFAYTALEKFIGARKNLREFEQSEEDNKKCHLCGEREGWIKAGIGRVDVGKYMDKNEGLCTVCFAKRALDKYLDDKFKYSSVFREFNFPSTAEVASSDFKKKALEKAKEEFRDYVEEFKNILGEKFHNIKVKPLPSLKALFENVENIDGEWFFESNLTKRKIKSELGVEVTDEEIDDLKCKLEKVTRKAGSPRPYYALIKLDGDDMGKWLSGEKLREFQHTASVEFGGKYGLLTPAVHSSISTALRNYTIEMVRRIVEEEHTGKLVYSGGDDVLAFVNLEDLFQVMKKLRAAFSGHVNFRAGSIQVDWSNNTGFVEKDGELILTMGKNAGASAGIAIAHYKEPLKIVLDRVNEMTNKAKETEGKDGFAIALMKFSGEMKIATSKWRFDDLDVVNLLYEVANYFKKEESKIWISNKVVYTLREEFKNLMIGNGRLTADPQLFKVELRRVIQRGINGGKEEERRKIAEEISSGLYKLFEKDEGQNLTSFLNLIEISIFIAGKEG
jgi:CRISPR-associated protein Cmr2